MATETTTDTDAPEYGDTVHRETSTAHRIVTRDAVTHRYRSDYAPGGIGESTYDGSAIVVTHHKDGTVSVRAPERIMQDIVDAARSEVWSMYWHSHRAGATDAAVEQCGMRATDAAAMDALALATRVPWASERADHAEELATALASYDAARDDYRGDPYWGIGIVGR